jgi:glutamate racemase
MSPQSALSPKPIGIFDSGVGGLTVVRAVRQRLPHEDIVYLGDTARVPYGAKSAETVVRYSLACARFLLAQDVKLLMVACNTASAHAMGALRRTVGVPVIGAVEPGAQTAQEATVSRHVGVVGTLGTVRSGAYQAALRVLDPDITVTGQACPLLVPLADEGWLEGEVPRLVAQRYVDELAKADPAIDTLVLGCTHYPLLQAILGAAAAAAWGRRVALVDSASAMARAAEATLTAREERKTEGKGSLRVFVTDASRLDEVAPRFLGEPIGSVQTVDL